MGRMTRAYQLTLAGFTDEADAIVAEAGRIDDWDLPAFFVVPALARAGFVAAALDRVTDLQLIVDRLWRFAASTRRLPESHMTDRSNSR